MKKTSEMKIVPSSIVLAIICITNICIFNVAASAMTPEQTVQNNLDFYNQRDIDGFMSLLSEHVAVYSLGEHMPSVAGSEDVRAFYQALFEQSPELHSTILKRIVIGNKVIDHESITGRNGSSDVIELVLVYEVEGQQIVKITVIRE